MGGGYSLSKSRKTQAVPSDYFEMGEIGKSKACSEREIWDSILEDLGALITWRKGRKHSCIMHCLTLSRCSMYVSGHAILSNLELISI